MTAHPFIEIANDPFSNAEAMLRSLRGLRGKFSLCLAGTETSDVPNVSAAGVTAQMRRLTPCTDAEVLVAGRAITADSIPVSPLGIVSPIVVTRACLNLLPGIEVETVDCGTFVAPHIAHDTAGSSPARSVATGNAMPYDQVLELYRKGYEYGAAIANEFDFVVAAECVPGGTTTAMGVLTALGYDVYDMLSSSLPQSQSDLRFRLVSEGLIKTGLPVEDFVADPFRAIAAVGDPMQAFVVGLLSATCCRVPVVLGGGSQMLAVFALYKAVLRMQPELISLLQPLQVPLVVTTKWVAYDPSARTIDLSRVIGAPYIAACPDFSKSRHYGLQAYEEGNVKEGTGAGASLALAHCLGEISESEIINAIDRVYDETVGSDPSRMQLAPV